MLLGPSRADLIDLLVESFPDYRQLRHFVQTHLTTPVNYETTGLTLPQTIGKLIDELDAIGVFDSFLKAVQTEFQVDVPQRSARIGQILREYYAGPPPTKLTRVTQRLNTREGMSAILAGLAALAVLHPSLQRLLERIVNSPLPGELFYTFSGLLGLLTLGMVWKVFRRRSRILRPEKFIIQPEDPHCFIGRDREVVDLSRECDQRSLVLLLGESGSGKSTLARLGLQSKFRAAGGATPRWHSVMIDGSTIIQWDCGLATELARQLLSLTPDVRENLGAARPPLTDDVFAWIETWSKTAPTRLLITFDQLDDYFESHRSRLMQGSRLLSPEELLATNADWQRLAQLCQSDRIHLLLVCRSDSLAHVVFRFTTSSDMPLQRIDSDLVSPLLTTITEPDGDGPVIENPDAGWTHLSSRLVDDLGRSGGVLPIQLVITLDALGKVRWLDSSEYAAGGGISGLGQKYIDRRIAEAVQLGGATPTDLLRGLVALTSQDGKKTTPLSPSQFQAAVTGSDTSDPRLETIVNHLCGRRILRKRESTDGQVIQLYHDFLAKPVREKFRLSNSEADLLETRSLEFKQSLGFVGGWRTLLSVREQLRIARARYPGLLMYVHEASLALLSLAKSLAIMMLICISGLMAEHQIKKKADYSRAERLVSEIGNLDTSKHSQVDAIRRLSESNLRVRFYAFEIGLSEAHIDKVINVFPLFLHITLGLADDPQPFATAIVRRMKTETNSTNLSLLGKMLGSLIPFPEVKDVQQAAAAIVKHMDAETDSENISHLCEALGNLTAKLEAKDVQPAAATIVKRMDAETDSERLVNLGESIESLSENLEIKDVQPAAVAILKRMETEAHSGKRSRLIEAFRSLNPKLDTKDVKQGAAAILKCMEIETDSESLSKMGDVIRSLSEKLEAKDVLLGAAAIVKRMETETDSDNLSKLGNSLESLSEKLEAKDVQALAAVIVKRMKVETDLRILFDLSCAIGSLNEKLEAKDMQPLATVIVKRMEAESDSENLIRLSRSLGRLTSKLQAKDVFPGAAVIVNRMAIETDANKLLNLGWEIGSLNSYMETIDVQSLAAAIVNRMEAETDLESILSLGDTIGSLTLRLQTKDVQKGAAVILKCMDVETDSRKLNRLSNTLGGMISKLETEDVRLGAAAIVNRMEAETDLESLVSLGEALGSLITKLEREDVQQGAAVIVKRMETETNSPKLIILSKVIESFCAKLAAEDVQLGATASLKRMEVETDSENLSNLGNSLARLSEKLETKHVQLGADTIVTRMETENELGNLSRLSNSLGNLAAKLEAKDVRPFAAAIVKRMETETDSDILSKLGNSIESLSEKLEAKDVQPGAAAILKQMETETHSGKLSRLSEAFLSLSTKLETKDVKLGAAVIVKRMEFETDSKILSDLDDAIGGLCEKLARVDQLKLLDLLKSPLIVEGARDHLLKAFDKAGVFDKVLYMEQEENLDIWTYVAWAKDPKLGGKYGIDLRRNPSESTPQLSQ